jgi:hypothetical protein
MGGLLILVVATAAFLAVSKYKVPALYGAVRHARLRRDRLPRTTSSS